MSKLPFSLTAIFVSVISCAVLGTSALASIFFIIPSNYEKINNPPPELVIANPYQTIDGKQINGVKFSMNDSWREEACSRNDRTGDDKTCGKALQAEPGAHIVGVVMCTDANCHGRGDAWQWRFKIHLGIRERVSLDLAKLAKHKKWPTEAKEIEALLTRTPLQGEKPSACVRAIEQAFYVDTCRASGFRELHGRIRQMDQICAKSWSEHTDMLFALAMWNAAYTHPKRCFPDVKRISPFLLEWYVDRNFWPAGTIENRDSSWAWARSAGRDDELWKHSGAEFRKRVLALLRRWHDRQVVVDQLIDAVTEPEEKLTPLLSAVARGKGFDMNPAEIDGHRNFALAVFASSDRRIEKDKRVAEVIAHKIATGGATSGKKQVHCGLEPEASLLAGAFTSDNTVSRKQWDAALILMRNTPNSESMHRCRALAEASMQSPVSLEERLMSLAKIDCAKNRQDDVRGSTLNAILERGWRSQEAPVEIAAKVMKANSDCVWWTSGRNDVKRDETTEGDYEIVRAYYPTGDLREFEVTMKTDRTMSAKINYAVNGKVKKVVCNTGSAGYKNSIAECNPHYKIDLQRAAQR